MKIYLVGGAVRDALLGLQPKEFDWVVVGATPEQLLNQGYQQVGDHFPVFLHPVTQEEYALARTERKQGHGYTGFAVYSAPDVSLEQDLLRRDLTINAIARERLPDGQLSPTLIDPYQGQLDLQARWLRHVSAAFNEDPLRILRVARFSAKLSPLGFNVHPTTLDHMQTMVAAGETDYLVPERVWQEFQRAMAEPDPVAFLQVLDQTGAKLIYPDHDHVVKQQSQQLLADVSIKTTDPELRTVLWLQAFDWTTDRLKHYFNTIKAPKHYHQLTLDVWQAQPVYKADGVTALLKQLDAYRQPERLQNWLQAYALLQPQAPLNLIEQAYQAACQINARELLKHQPGLQGPAVGQALDTQRHQIIQAQLQT